VLWRDDRLRVVHAPELDHPGLLRVIWHAHVREMTDLSAADRRHVMEAVFAAEHALREVLGPLKINLASFGNMVPHLHWHVIPRHEDDPHYPNAIWGVRQRDGAHPMPGDFAPRVAGRLAALLGVPRKTASGDDESVQGFYDGMAGQYHEMFADWRADVRAQALALERLLSVDGPPGPWRILDCACGIGTQAIGFALRGHSVHATDLSPGPLERARRERLIEAAREVLDGHPLGTSAGVTAVNEQVLVLRVLAPLVEPTMGLLKAVWQSWRLQAWQLEAPAPRIWAT